MKGKAAWVSCRETRFLPASSLPALHLIMAGKVTLGAGHEGSQSMGMVLLCHAAGPAQEELRGAHGPGGASCWILHGSGKWP